jgi:membrane protease subunit HflC
MKIKIAAILVVVLGIAAIVLYSSVYVVEEGKQVIVTQFGNPVRTVTDAGLHYKSPFIQEVHYLEKRLLPWDGEPVSMRTNDKKEIDIDVWARWRIIDPKLFFQAVGDEQNGQGKLDGRVNSAVRDVVALHNLIDVVRRSNKDLEYESEDLERIATEKVKGQGRDDVEAEILRNVDLREFGMELTMVRIKRVNFVESVRQTVYDRMISERLQIARLYDSEAQEERKRILGQTQKELDQIEGEMKQESAEIRGKADALVIKMTAEAYGGEALDFYEFLRRLEVFKVSLGRDTRLILSTESDLFRLLKQPGEPSPRSASPSLTSP